VVCVDERGAPLGRELGEEVPQDVGIHLQGLCGTVLERQDHAEEELGLLMQQVCAEVCRKLGPDVREE
jgi:hypothetical protein